MVDYQFIHHISQMDCPGIQLQSVKLDMTELYYDLSYTALFYIMLYVIVGCVVMCTYCVCLLFYIT